MTIRFEGRFHSPYSANFSDYFKCEYQTGGSTLADAPGLDTGRDPYYAYADDPTGEVDRVARLTAPSARPGRIELRPFEWLFTSNGGPEYGECWIAYWNYLPSGSFDLYERSGSNTPAHALIASSNTNLFQIHHEPDDDDHLSTSAEPSLTGQAAVMLSAENRHIEWRFCWDENATSTQLSPSIATYKHKLRLKPLLNRWNEWVFHYKGACDNTGFCHIYLNRYLLFSRENAPTMFNDQADPYFKAGCYKFFNTSVAGASPSQVTLYTRGIVVGDESSSYEEVTGHASLGRTIGVGLRRVA